MDDEIKNYFDLPIAEQVKKIKQLPRPAIELILGEIGEKYQVSMEDWTLIMLCAARMCDPIPKTQESEGE